MVIRYFKSVAVDRYDIFLANESSEDIAAFEIRYYKCFWSGFYYVIVKKNSKKFKKFNFTTH